VKRVLTPIDHVCDAGVPLGYRAEIVWDKEVSNCSRVFHPTELVFLQGTHKPHGI